MKYLNRFGWEPIVLTARKSWGGDRPPDPALLEELPVGTDVIRTPSIEPLGLLLRLVKMMRNWPRIDDAVKDSCQPVAAKAISAKEVAKSIYNAVVEQPLSIPDRYVGWVPFSVMRARRAIKEQAPSVIFTSSPPLSTHLVGFVLKKMFHIPWVADFRDVWPSFFAIHTAGRKEMADRMGIRILEQADRVVSISEEMSRNLALLCPHLPKRKFCVVANGFDSDDYRDVPPFDFGKFTILHTGEVFGRDPSVFIAACEELVAKGLVGEDFQAVFQGTVFKGFAKVHLGSNSYLKVLDPVSHREAISSMLGANVLLLLVGNSKDHAIGYPVKFFEYMAANKPILAISPDGPCSTLIKTARLGSSYYFGQKDLVMGYILRLYLQWKEKTLRNNRDEEVVRAFERKHLTEKLASILGELVP